MSDKTHERWLTPFPCYNKTYSMKDMCPLADSTQTLQWTLAQTIMSSPTAAGTLLGASDLSTVPWPDAFTVTHIRGEILVNYQVLLGLVSSNSYLSLGIVQDTAELMGTQTIFNPSQYLDSQRHWKWLHHEMWAQSPLFSTFNSNIRRIQVDVPVNIRVSDLDRLSLCAAWWTRLVANSDIQLTLFLRLLATGAT